MGISIPELDDIGYQELRDESEARLPKDAPEWSDHNLSDPGITFLEMFSWLSDIELYRLNRITPKHLQNFLALLGDRYPSAKASNGVIVSTQSISSDVEIAAGAVVELKGKRLFRTKKDFYGNPAQIKSVEVLRGKELFKSRPVNGEIEPFYAFGEVAQSGNYFRINLSEVSSKRLHLYIDLKESDLPSYNEDWCRDIEWLKDNDSVVLEWYLVVDSNEEHIITPQEDATLNLRYSGVVSFVIEKSIDKDARVSILCKLKTNSYMITPFIKNIYLNVIEIEQSQAVVEKILSSGEANQVLTLKQQFVLDGGNDVSIKTKSSSDGTIELWKRVDSLYHEEEESSVFLYDNTTQKVIFGDGRRGAIVPYNDTIICSYAVCEGKNGDVSSRVDDWEVENLTFYNHKSIDGGKNILSYDERFTTIVESWRKPTEAVTLEDYEALAKMTPGLRVARAKATADREQNHIKVIVVPYSRSNYALADNFFCNRVCRFLDDKRLITTSIEVVKPLYTKVGVTLHIKSTDRANQKRVHDDVIKAIDEYLHPLKGGDESSGWEFGRSVYASDIYALVELIDGVLSILNISFYGEGKYDGSKKSYAIPKGSLIVSLKHKVTVEHSNQECGGVL